jgi:hypothetical protein
MTDNRDLVIEMVEDGVLDPMMALTMCLKWMSNDEVAEMLDANELSERFLEDDDDNALIEEF